MRAPKTNACCVCGKTRGPFAVPYKVMRLRDDASMIASADAIMTCPAGTAVHDDCYDRAQEALKIISKNRLQKAFD